MLCEEHGIIFDSSVLSKLAELYAEAFLEEQDRLICQEPQEQKAIDNGD